MGFREQTYPKRYSSSTRQSLAACITAVRTRLVNSSTSRLNECRGQRNGGDRNRYKDFTDEAHFKRVIGVWWKEMGLFLYSSGGKAASNDDEC